MIQSAKDLEAQLERVRRFESNVTFQLSIASRLMDMDVSQLLKDTPLNLTGYRILRTIETFERISMADLARYTVIDNAQISRTSADLRERGFIEIEADPSSKRRKIVVMTPQGESLLKELDPRIQQRRQRVKDCLGDELMAQLSAALERLTTNFGA